VSRVEAIISDFGGVLTSPLFNAFAHVQEAQGITVEALGKAMWRATQERGENPLFPLERGELSEPEFLRVVGDALSAEVGREVSMRDFAEGYFAQLSTNDELLGYLRSLKDERGVRLAMLTNNVREWEPRWRAMIPDLDETFELVVDSAFVGMRKPEPGIYELTLERLGLPAGACVFIDDLEANCDAAEALGIRAVRFADTAQAIAAVEALFDGAG
jgi:putative hydrolase of the HAD superfamily